MRILLSQRAERDYRKLPLSIKRKTDKQSRFLGLNMRHPSLRVKKMQGSGDYEARIDYHYRLIFSAKKDTIEIIALGPHDEGLGKK